MALRAVYGIWSNTMATQEPRAALTALLRFGGGMAQLQFNEQGLIPAIAQDYESGAVLMLPG